GAATRVRPGAELARGRCCRDNARPWSSRPQASPLQPQTATPIRPYRGNATRSASARPLPSSPMKIEKDRVVLFHYSVAEQGGEPLESSEGRGPLAILIGHGNIIPGLEKAMEG